jgi:hypothetical protein
MPLTIALTHPLPACTLTNRSHRALGGASAQVRRSRFRSRSLTARVLTLAPTPIGVSGVHGGFPDAS